MKTIADLKGEDLRWVQPRLFRHTYELRTMTGDVVATITRTGLFREVDQAEAAGERWTITHVGGLSRRFEIRPAESPDDAPRYVFHQQGCQLDLPGGGAARWEKLNDQGDAVWQWTGDDGECLLKLSSGDGERITSHIRLELGAADAGTRLLLAMLGSYMILLYGDEVA
ncbi:MAG: hypothetical protein IT320_16670 [Anaerolineae bacterium]|nr:hypothetical protein [Anaerolineae bacterium]